MRALRSLLALVVILGCAAPAAAQMKPPPPDPALAALPGKIVAIMNSSNPGALQTMCAANATIVDEFPPYLWTGAGSCAKYTTAFKGFLAQAKLTGLSGGVTGTPYTDSSGNNGYVTAHIHFTGKMAGKPAVDDGWWAIVAVKSGGTWKIASISWALSHH